MTQRVPYRKYDESMDRARQERPTLMDSRSVDDVATFQGGLLTCVTYPEANGDVTRATTADVLATSAAMDGRTT